MNDVNIANPTYAIPLFNLYPTQYPCTISLNKLNISINTAITEIKFSLLWCSDAS